MSSLVFLLSTTPLAVSADGPPKPVLDTEAVLRPRDVRYYRSIGPGTGEPAYGRAALEMLGVLGLGTIQYWLAAHQNSRDWDFPRWSERLELENIRLDNNTMVTNNLLHPLAGGAYYGLARVNGLSVGESVLYAQLSSAIWEWGLEWREKASINDMITTTAAGTAVGEFLVQLGSYLNSAPGETSWAQDVAKTTIGLAVWVHDELDGVAPDPRPAEDSLGFSSAYHHRFTAEYRSLWLDDADEQEQSALEVALSGQLASLPGLFEPKSFGRAFAGGNFSDGSVSLLFRNGALRATEVEFNAVLAGYYAQLATPHVVGLLVGLGTGLDFVDRDTLGRHDQYALAHFVGPTAAVFWKRAGFEATLAARAYGDFATIHSLAWARQREEPGVYKSSLAAGEYQYHLGLSARLYAELRVHAALLSAEQILGHYHSIEGLDRFQEAVTRDLEGEEALDERRITLALEPPRSALRAFAGVERFSHRSVLGRQRAGRLERRLVAGVGLAF